MARQGRFHYRWTRKKDQRLAAQRSIEDYYVTTPPEDRKAAEDLAIETMAGQLKTMQLEGELGGVVEKSFKRFIKLLDDHLRKHLFIFGDRPSIADFAIAGQLIQMMKDPTPAKIIEKDGEFVAKWCEFMAAPTASGPFAALDDLKETLAPIFADDLVAGSSCRGPPKISRTRSPAPRPSTSRSARTPSRSRRCARPRARSASCAASS